MEIIQYNPYRTVGLLVGATAREQDRQVKRLKQFISAEQDPQEDYSFPSLGELNRTIESVAEAASKLNLDSDKMHAALFWFYNGNAITDEAAFDALKEGDSEKAIEIWRKLALDPDGDAYNEVVKRNASAFQNLSTLYLHEYGIDEDTLQMKLLFLESDYFNELKSKATDETYKISPKEIQLLFLNSLSHQDGFDPTEFIEAISNVEFIAKEEFLKSFTQKPVEQIEKKIEESKSKRKANKENAIEAGNNLLLDTKESVNQLKSMLGKANAKYSSIADKLANEILQCSIDYFNESQESGLDINYFEPAMKLAKSAEALAVGKLAKDRIKDNIETLEGMKDQEISQAIEVLKSIKVAYDTNKAEITTQVNGMRLGYNQTINWTKVNQMIENSLDWDKVVSLIQEVIPQKNVDRIKNVNNQIKINEYKSLASFVMTKLSYLQKNKVRYICYWESSGPAMPTPGDIAKIPNWIKWVAGIILFIILTRAC